MRLYCHHLGQRVLSISHSPVHSPQSQYPIPVPNLSPQSQSLIPVPSPSPSRLTIDLMAMTSMTRQFFSGVRTNWNKVWLYPLFRKVLGEFNHRLKAQAVWILSTHGPHFGGICLILKKLSCSASWDGIPWYSEKPCLLGIELGQHHGNDWCDQVICLICP